MLVSGLFAGIGGFELGLELAGHRPTLLCDNCEYASRVLRRRWPEARFHADVADLAELPEDAELVTAGFPCQNLSMAGDKAGLDGGKSGIVDHLFRLLDVRAVPWVLIENVYFMLHLQRGAAIDSILKRLERRGYRWAYRVVDSRSFGLAQRRRRVFILASQAGDPRKVLLADDAPGGKPPKFDVTQSVGSRPLGFYWTEGRVGHGLTAEAIPPLKAGSTLAIPSPPAVLLPSGRVVTPPIEALERLQGFRPRWTSALRGQARRQRWRLVGNAVSVPVAKWIGGRLADPVQYDEQADTHLRPGTPWPTAGWNVDGRRMVADVSEFPVKRRLGRLSAFNTAKWPNLSQRALSGFAKRAREGGLRYPPGFLDAIEANLSERPP
ncbi:MAG: DNA (cytosine-5-)-methyltransferase [Acidobacteriota bacterium]|nr:DNA (cytosine-5-)-methyltransferase [Acidobacteriota bacterium]MDE3266669.1 DNA (cytosine-5-)-methyltransferase [Acidobacteriota bacterium]